MTYFEDSDLECRVSTKFVDEIENLLFTLEENLSISTLANTTCHPKNALTNHLVGHELNKEP